MLDTERKCIALRKLNKLYVEDLVRQRIFKSFSHAINDLIEKDQKKKGE